MMKYGFQLVIAELFTIAAIYNIRLIIDFLKSGDSPIAYYNIVIFTTFFGFRLLAVIIRNYYDLHVYNFFRYV